MPQATIDRNQVNNWFQTILMILLMAAILGVTGFAIFGFWGFVGAIGLLVGGLAFSPRVSAAMVLRMYNAQPITHESSPQLVEIFQEICQRANLRQPPRLFYIPSRMPNAFAVGTGKYASVAVTDGLLQMLTPREMAGVLAHEVSHILNRDLLVLGLADAITRTTSTLARIGLLLLFISMGRFLFGQGGGLLVPALILFCAPIAVVVLQLTISRTREFDADQGAAELTGDPAGLAIALQKLDPPKRTTILEKILQPGKHRKEPAMLRTHPPTEERVKELMKLANIQRETLAPQNPIEFLDVQAGEHNTPIAGRPPIVRRPSYHVISGIWH